MPSEIMAIAQLSAPSHSCLVYQTPTEQTAVTCEFLARGLTRGERCVFLETSERVQAVRNGLAQTGIDVTAEEDRGALVLSSERDFLKDGHFDGTRTIAFLDAALEQALSRGFTALRATGDMNWELGADQNFELLVDYEAELDRFVSHHKIVGLCQYKRHTISGLAIRNALETHANIILGQLLCTNNLYYEPPDIRLSRDLSDAQDRRAEWMCRRLEQAMRAERQRHNALESLLKER